MTAPAPWLVRRLRALGLSLEQAGSIASGQGAGGGLPADAVEHYAETGAGQTPDQATYYVLWNGDADPASEIVDTGDGPHGVVVAGGAEGIYAVWFDVSFAPPAQKTIAKVSTPGFIVAGSATLETDFGQQEVFGSGVMRLEAGQQLALLVQLLTGPAADPVLPNINSAYIGFKRIA